MILQKGQFDEIFAMGIHQWIELSRYLVSLQDYSLGQKLDDNPTIESFSSQHHICLHAILMAQIYKQLLIKGKNCNEQIWLKSQLLKSQK